MRYVEKTAIFLAEGFEEVEALAVVDILRRADIDISMVSITGSLDVTGSHGITVKADVLFEDYDTSDLELMILPGGMPGTKNLEAHEGLMKALDDVYARGKYIGAICAAPTILGHRGMLKGVEACCYPGLEGELEGAIVPEDRTLCFSDRFVTASAMGNAIPFALDLVSISRGAEAASKVQDSILW